MQRAAWVLGLAVLAGCPAPLSRGARAQDAVQELNLHTRFGRLQVAMERVAPEERDRFFKRHAQWGGRVRIADHEIYGMKLTGDDTADVAVRYAWYRPDQQELKQTTIRQKWRDKRGDWQLVSEDRAEGDAGLIGDDPPPSALEAPEGGPAVRAKSRAQFPTIRIGEHPPEP